MGIFDWIKAKPKTPQEQVQDAAQVLSDYIYYSERVRRIPKENAKLEYLRKAQPSQAIRHAKMIEANKRELGQAKGKVAVASRKLGRMPGHIRQQAEQMVDKMSLIHRATRMPV